MSSYYEGCVEVSNKEAETDSTLVLSPKARRTSPFLAGGWLVVACCGTTVQYCTSLSFSLLPPAAALCSHGQEITPSKDAPRAIKETAVPAIILISLDLAGVLGNSGFEEYKLRTLLTASGSAASNNVTGGYPMTAVDARLMKGVHSTLIIKE